MQQVQVLNLTQGTDTILSGGNFNFELPYELGINETFPGRKGSFVVSSIYPNPFQNYSAFTINTLKTVGLQISLYSASGMLLTHFENRFGEGVHEFEIDMHAKGLGFLIVSDGEVNYLQKIVCLGSSGSGGASVIYKGNSGEKDPFKMSQNEGPFQYTLGDQLQFIGYAAGYANSTIYDSPDSDTTYTFEFTDPFYRITGHLIETSMPCFVDILFSVDNEQFKGVDNLNNENFIVYEDGSTISPTETFRYIRKANTLPYKIKTVILLDNSASVADKIDQIKEAAIALVNTITDNQEFAVFSFSEDAVLLQDFTNDVSLLTAAINSMSTGFATTNLYGAFIDGVNKWNDTFSTELIEQGFLVVFSDGDDTQGSFTLEQAVAARGNKKAYLIGLGDEISPGPLNQLANPGPYFPITDINELEQVFQEIQSDIIRYANSFYWLNYMTPKRQNIHTLRLEIIDNMNTGPDSYFEGQFNANGFDGVFSGVYLNTTPSDLYGIDSITIQNPDPYELRAVTYWAYGPPEYSWSSTNNNIVSLTTDPLYYNKAMMNFPGIEGGSAYVTVTDETNLYEKTIKVTAYTPPVVTTSEVSEIDYTTATGGGNVSGDGGLPVTHRGVCWNTNPNPTINNPHTTDGSGTGVFESQITNLSPNTTYYVRAYAKNSKGTSYGEQKSFSTLQPGAPEVVTLAASNITPTNALLNGEVSSDGGNPVTSRGFCWSTEPNPGFDDQTVQSGSGVGAFSATVSNLSPQTTYYVRAYATNSINSVFGNEVSFVATNYTPATVTTSDITGIGCDFATGGGNVSNEGNSPVTARGICWSTTPDPTIDDAFTNDGPGGGSFTSQMNGLTPLTTYYVRAYATNTSGTSYGTQKIFTTEECTPATVTTSDVTNITYYSAIGAGNVTNDGNSNITARGICWSTTPNPSLDDAHTIEPGGTGTFNSNINGLIELTTYYVRAYVTNGTGTTYGNEVTFNTVAFICGEPLIDSRDGQSYTTVQIGGQCWMAENLNIGVMIQSNINMSNNGVIEKYCYDNSVSNCDVYGGLYQWNEMMEYSTIPSVQGICDNGWHLPSQDEWNTLAIFVGNPAGGKMKETGYMHWNEPNTGATNSTGFTGLPGGFRSNNYAGLFYDIKNRSYIWSSTQYSSHSYFYKLTYNGSSLEFDHYDKIGGLTVRCLKD